MGRTKSRFVTAISAVLLFALSACGTPALAGPSSLAAPAATEPLFVTAPPSPSDTLPAATATLTPTSLPTPSVTALQDENLQRQIDQLANWFQGQNRNPGLGVSVVVRNKQTGQLQEMLLNYGAMGKGSGQLVTSDTVYEIGSITKVFTGILLAEAADSGAVQLTDPIQKYLPPGIQAPTYGDVQITLADLATHHSSLPRDINTDGIPDMYDWLNGFQLSRAPGTEYIYSNAGYSLLGDMLARMAGSDFNTLEFQSVSQPLGLMDTREVLTADEADRQALGYGYDGSSADYFPDSGAMSSAGYMRSTLSDMTRFLVDNMQAGSTPLGDALQLAQTLQAPGPNPATGVGLGWEIADLGTTGERLYKGGGTNGFTSYISFMRDGSYGFVLLSNGMYVENLVPHMLGIMNSVR